MKNAIASNGLLMNALNQDSGAEKECLQVFLKLAAKGDVKASLNAVVSDWTITDFYFQNTRICAAYSELQESVRILSFKTEVLQPIKVFNSSLKMVETFFLAWTEEAI